MGASGCQGSPQQGAAVNPMISVLGLAESILRPPRPVQAASLRLGPRWGQLPGASAEWFNNFTDVYIEICAYIIYIYIHDTCMCIHMHHLSIHPSIHQCMHPSINLSILTIYLLIYLFIYLPTYLSNLHVYAHVCTYIYL